jgi:hypothetical protein
MTASLYSNHMAPDGPTPKHSVIFPNWWAVLDLNQ